MNTDNNKKQRIAVALGDFDGMHRAHQTVTTGAQKVIIFCVNNKFSLLQKSIFEQRYPNAVFASLISPCFTHSLILVELIGKSL